MSHSTGITRYPAARAGACCLGLLFLLLTGCAGDDVAPIVGRRVTIPDAHVSMDIPDGISVTGRHDASDLTIYDFSEGDKVILGLYVGPAPTFLPAKDDAGVDTETVGGMPARTRVAKTASGWSRDLVVEAPNRRFFHFFYRNLRTPDLALADHIIGSVRDEP